MEALTYRVAQEAVRNVARHAGGATRVTVDVTRRSGCLRLEVADDGPGFTLAELEGRRSDGHLGLHLLADLVSDAGGHLDVSSVPGNGARVTLEVPVQ
jgi:signal transduction histidine kinase